MVPVTARPDVSGEKDSSPLSCRTSGSGTENYQYDNGGTKVLQFAASPGSSPGVIAWQQTHLWSWIPGDRGEDIKTTQVSWLHATLKQNHDLAEGEEASSSSQVITDPDFNIRGHELRKRRRTGTTVSTWYRWSGPGQSSEKTDQDFNRKYMLVNTACWHHEVRVLSE